MNSPSGVSEEQLKDLHIKIDIKEKWIQKKENWF
jgi:hypothetical protein